jgi:hypothetical protein
MLIVLSILAIMGIALLILACVLLRTIRFAIHLISQQLEYLGAPLKLSDNGVLYAARRTDHE